MVVGGVIVRPTSREGLRVGLRLRVRRKEKYSAIFGLLNDFGSSDSSSFGDDW